MTLALPEAGSLLRRLLRSGAGPLAATATLVVVPLAGAAYLPDEQYVAWALLATLSTVGLTLDFGATAWTTRQVALGRRPAAAVRRAAGTSALGTALVVLLAAAAWPAYARAAGLALGGAEGVAAVLAVGAGTAARGAVLVAAAAALALRDDRARTVLLLGQAAAQVVLTVLLLEAGLGHWALPLGLLVASAVAMPLARGVLRRPGDDVPTRAGEGLAFARARGAATLASLVMTQLDRWVLALVAAPSLLAAYDVAARLALLPKTVVLALAGGLVAEAARGPATRAALLPVLRSAQRLAAVLVAAGSLGVLALAGGLALLGQAGGGVFVALLVALLVWHGVHALTAPATLLATGAGRPQAELAYLLPCLATCLAGWAVGLALSSVLLVVLAPGLSLLGWSVWFLRRSSRTVLGG